MNQIVVFLLLFSLSFFRLSGQDTYFEFGFDGCTFEENASKFPGITPGGSPECVCGLNVQSYKLNGSTDNLKLSSQANTNFSSDFTFDFYFSLGEANGEVDIFSHRNGCSSLDSLMALRYFSATNEVLFEIGSNVNNYFSVRSKLNENICWHRFTLVKFGIIYSVYVDNVMIKEIISKERIELSRLTTLSFANSPCTSGNLIKFDGKIDEITMYKRALSSLELVDNFLYPDQIITPNSTIFSGESITLNLGTTCASIINWSPSISLDDPNGLAPVATPEVSTTYQVRLDNGGCISTDTVRIFVADKAKLDCNALLVPKAFTPNNDGLNDRFGISNTFLVDELKFFEIYDRSGAKIWETNDLTNTWDGTFNGKDLTGGMFLFKIKYVCNGQEKFFVDNFAMLK